MQKPATGANRLTFAAVSKAGACNNLRREPNGLGHDIEFAVCRLQIYDATLEQEISNKSLKQCLVFG